MAGLSMGGYGALKLGLSHPDRFAAVASLSGVADVRGARRRLERAEMVERVFGGRFGRHDDLFELLAATTPAALPPLYIALRHRGGPAAGGQHPARRPAARAGRRVTTDFRPGVHEWGLWDDVIQDVIAWLPLP